MAQSPVPGLSVVRWLAGVLLIAACITIQAGECGPFCRFGLAGRT